jgi:recombination protein RecA
MSISALRSEIESALTGRFKSLKLAAAPFSEFDPSGIQAIDSIAGGLPRGAITELIGPASSGRTSLLLSVLAEATKRQEICALVDLNDAFDIEAALGMKIEFDYLLWIRCSANLEHALKATELLLQSAGFGLVALDLGDLAVNHAHRVPLSSWFRLRRTVEDTPTSLLVIEQQPSARTCASLILETNRESVKWPEESNPPLEGSALFGGLRLRIERHKPISSKERQTRFETTF